MKSNTICVILSAKGCDHMSLGSSIYWLRTSLKLSQVDFAKKIGSSQSAVTAWENGVRKPTVKMLETISNTFNVSIDNFINPPDHVPTMRESDERDSRVRVLNNLISRMSDQQLIVLTQVAVEFTRKNGDDSDV